MMMIDKPKLIAGRLYLFPEVVLMLPSKLHWWHRFWLRLFFGWRWEDDENDCAKNLSA